MKKNKTIETIGLPNGFLIKKRDDMLSLYIHIPFCIKKCGYCDFLSFDYKKDLMTQYVQALIKEIKLYEPQSVYTIFFGGGTPSLLSSEQITEIMEVLKDHFDLSACQEITIEVNPGTLTESKLMTYKALGINRISMGVQTLMEDSLKTLGRIHDVQTVYDTVELLKKHDFSNYNMDLMFGLPYQTVEMLDKTVDKMIALNPSHISAYSLKIEEDTPFDDLYDEIDEEMDRRMYHLIIDKLHGAGYRQYEISNFSKDQYACKHNLVYWQEGNYLGLGLGASGFINNERYTNEKDFESYFNKIDAGLLPVHQGEIITKDALMFEMIILRLRLNEGLEIKRFNERFSVDFKSLYNNVLEELLEEELIVMDSHVRLTSLGRDLSNSVYIKFL